jgi:hypothetical protein
VTAGSGCASAQRQLHVTLHAPLFFAKVEEEFNSWNQNANDGQMNLKTHQRKDV